MDFYNFEKPHSSLKIDKKNTPLLSSISVKKCILNQLNIHRHWLNNGGRYRTMLTPKFRASGLVGKHLTYATDYETKKTQIQHGIQA